jgi:MFS family permease
MQRTTQDWIVLTELTDHNATAVGVVIGLQFGPPILLLPLTGLAADHLDRRKLLFCTQAAMGVLAPVSAFSLSPAWLGCGTCICSRFCSDAPRRSIRRRGRRSSVS